MRKIKKVKIKTVKTPDICIGDPFIYKDIKWICLDIIDSNYLAITAKVWQELPFDFGNHNNWKESYLRRVLNDKFLDKLNKNHLVKQTSDLIADNGDKRYGSCEDYVTILSCDVPCYPERMWTLTPWSCYDSLGGTGGTVRLVNPTGNINDYSACFGYGVAPVCLFSSEILKSSHLGIQKPNQLGGSCR